MDEKRYEEVGTNYRFFLSWRHAAFAGDLIVIFSVLSLTFSIYNENPSMAWIIPAMASPVGILLLIIDIRTRDLYHAAINAGKDLEGERGGFYTNLSKEVLPKDAPQFSKTTQSTALEILFIGSSVLLLLFSLCMAIISK